MRTDYKIGIAVVLFLAAVIVVYNIYTPGPEAQTPDAPELAQNPADTPPGDISPGPAPGTSTSGNEVLSGFGPVFVNVDPPSDPLAEVQADAPEGESAPPGTESSDPPTGAEQLPSTTSTRTVDTAWRDESPAGSLRTVVAETPPPPAARIYVVQQGDNGFWTVSNKMYGNGKHWAVIQKANPNANPDALRPGQKLKVPPLAQTPSRAGDTRPTRALGQVVQEAGKRYYYVRKGDPGFWRVSEVAYGNGKHWALIKKANPSADSQNLRVGQRLIIPPLSTARDGEASAALERTLRPGEKWYIVREGDAGFWDAAEHTYGRGMGIHWRRIAKANPQITNPGRLRPGQRLLIPPLTEGDQTASSER